MHSIKAGGRFHIRYDCVFVCALFFCFLLVAAWSLSPEAAERPWIEVSYGEKELRIHSWYDAGDERLYFFLPASALAASGARLRMPPNAELLLGDMRLRDLDALPEALPEGEGIVRYNDGSKREEPVTLLMSSSLPAVFMETRSGSLDAIHGDITHEEEGTLLIVGANGETDYEGALASIRERGQSARNYPKKSYTLQVPSAASLLHMGAGVKWVLSCNMGDPSLLRNRMAYETARKAQLPYAVEDAYVDLYINSEYRGLYQLVEGVEVGEARVDIEDLAAATQAVNLFDLKDYPKTKTAERLYSEIPFNPPDITGGYLMELEMSNRYETESNGLVSQRGKYVTVKSPKHGSPEQIGYIADVMDEAEEAIYARDGIHPQTGKAFTDYIDLTSWVKRFLIDEIFMDVDVDRTSSYLYKRSGDERLYAGPAWDFDISLGEGMFLTDRRWVQYANPRAFYALSDGVAPNGWYQTLYGHPAFYEALVMEYQKVFLPILKEWLDGKIEEYRAELQASVKMNNARWSVLGRPTTDQGQRQDIRYLQDFLARRVAFLNSIWIDEEPYGKVKILFRGGGAAELFVKPGVTLEEELAAITPLLENQSFFTDGDYQNAFDPRMPITEDVTLYIDMPPELERDFRPAYLESYRPLYVKLAGGEERGVCLKPGQSFWDGVLKGRPSWQNQSFYADPAHTIPFDVHAPIEENITLYLKPSFYEKNQNILFLAAILAVGAILLAAECRRNQLARKNRRTPNERKQESIQA